MHHERLAQGDHTLLGTGDGALEHQVVVLDDTVVGEATHGRDRLLGDIRLSRRVAVIRAETDAVDLFVELRAVVVTVCDRAVREVFPQMIPAETHFDQHGRRRT